MTALPSLSIVIATTGPRSARLVLPPPAPGIDYVVCVQAQTGPVPAWATRADARLVPEHSHGLSRNRMAGLAAAQGALVLFSDDDIHLDMAGIDALRAAFAADPSLSLALGWRTGHRPETGGRAGPHRLTRFNTGHACVPEIMVRRADVLRAGVTFDPAFGVGAHYPLGEDYIFVTDLLRAGLKGRGFPVETGAHPHASTGDDWRDPILMQARRAMLARVFGPLHPAMRALYTIRHRRRFATRSQALRFLLGRS
ncbi:MAG: hypothetical protein AAFU63_00235 [Pseudomonadota bacterium]